MGGCGLDEIEDRTAHVAVRGGPTTDGLASRSARRRSRHPHAFPGLSGALARQRLRLHRGVRALRVRPAAAAAAAAGACCRSDPSGGSLPALPACTPCLHSPPCTHRPQTVCSPTCRRRGDCLSGSSQDVGDLTPLLQALMLHSPPAQQAAPLPPHTPSPSALAAPAPLAGPELSFLSSHFDVLAGQVLGRLDSCPQLGQWWPQGSAPACPPSPAAAQHDTLAQLQQGIWTSLAQQESCFSGVLQLPAPAYNALQQQQAHAAAAGHQQHQQQAQLAAGAWQNHRAQQQARGLGRWLCWHTPAVAPATSVRGCAMIGVAAGSRQLSPLSVCPPPPRVRRCWPTCASRCGSRRRWSRPRCWWALRAATSRTAARRVQGAKRDVVWRLQRLPAHSLEMGTCPPASQPPAPCRLPPHLPSPLAGGHA